MTWEDRYLQQWHVPEGFTNALTDKLAEKLLKTDMFLVMEREELTNLGIERNIKEENTNTSQRGKIIPAQALVRCRVSNFEVNNRGGGGGISVGPVKVGGAKKEAVVGLALRLIDASTSEVIKAESAEGRCSEVAASFGLSAGSFSGDFGAFEKSPLGKATDQALDRVVKLVVDQLKDRPWTCLVSDFDSDAKELTLNAGTKTGVKVGDTFEVQSVTKEITDPETGEKLGVRTKKVGMVEITEVAEKFSIAKVVSGEGFKRGDIVKEVR